MSEEEILISRSKGSTTKVILVAACAVAVLLAALSQVEVLQPLLASNREHPFSALPGIISSLEQDDELVFTGRTEEEEAFLSKSTWVPEWSELKGALRALIIKHPEAHFGYCSVGKNGCTYHMGLIHRLHGAETYNLTDTVHNQTENRQWMAPRALTDVELSSVLLNDSFPKYMVVRNPMSRALSAYRNKVEGPRRVPPSEAPERFRDWVLSEEFPVGHQFSELELSVKNPHWMPQYIHCGMQKARFFKVFKFEEPETYVRFIYKIMPRRILDSGWGEEQDLSFADFQLGPRTRTGNTSDSFVRYYTTLDVFDRVAEVYKRDIEMFNYQEDVDKMRQDLVSRIQRR